jgi:hypothetical protein
VRGKVWSWGYNKHLQLGRREPPYLTAEVPDLPPIKAIAAGADSSLALDDSGVVWAWGTMLTGSYADTDQGMREDSLPHRVDGVPRAEAIATAGPYALAISNGILWAWGIRDPTWSAYVMGPTEKVADPG